MEPWSDVASNLINMSTFKESDWLRKKTSNWIWLVADLMTTLVLCLAVYKIFTNKWAHFHRTKWTLLACLFFAILTLIGYFLYFYFYALDYSVRLCDNGYPSCVPLTADQQRFYDFMQKQLARFILISIPTDIFDSLAKMLYLLVQIDLLQVFSVLSDSLSNKLFNTIKKVTIVLHVIIGIVFLVLDGIEKFYPPSWTSSDKDWFGVLYFNIQSILYLAGNFYFVVYEAWHYYHIYGFLKLLAFRVKNKDPEKLKNLVVMRMAVHLLIFLDVLIAASSVFFALDSYAIPYPPDLLWTLNMFVFLMYVHVVIIAWLNARAKRIQFPQPNKKLASHDTEMLTNTRLVSHMNNDQYPLQT